MSLIHTYISITADFILYPQEFEFNANEDLHDLKLPMEVRRNVYLIFKESTNNLVKYANASRVRFSIKEENRNLTMMIQDNGKGFDTDKANKGNGLHNMKKRAEEIGGHLWIESRQNEGTTITLRLAV
jgi:signal transduction histidine kinase